MIGANTRFLFSCDKIKIIAEWEGTKKNYFDGHLAGAGEPDYEMIPWCDQLNKLHGVCTLQSCAGHRVGDVFTPGHLWILMSQSVANQFDHNAFMLLNHRELIEWISWHYLHEGKKIASITFSGNERNLLEKSMYLIYEFLSNISEVDD